MEEYLNLFNNKVNPYITLKNSGAEKLEDMEKKLPGPLFELHSLIGKILRDNNILSNEE